MIAVIFGRTGSGKSKLLAALSAKHPRRLVIDPKNQFPEIRLLDVKVELAEFLAAHPFPQPFAVRVCPISVEEFDTAIYLALWRKHVALSIDEADMFSGGKALKEAIMRGRHDAVSILATTRRPYEIPRDLSSQAGELYSFRQHERRDLDYMRTYFGDAALEILPELDDHAYMRYTDGRGYTIYPPLDLTPAHIHEARE
jgi:energy-coupling factor transporter ATP-binding protein EcfA2